MANAFEQAQRRANSRNQARLNQATALYDSIIAQFSGGEKSPLMTSVNKQLEIGGRKAVSQGMQSLVNAGLSGSSVASGLGTKYEEEVGAPTRLNALDTIAQRLANAQMGKAGLLERVEESGPDAGLMANLMQAANSGGGGGYDSGGFVSRIPGNYYNSGNTGGVSYGSTNNMGRYQPAQVSIRNGAATKNLASSFLADASSRGWAGAQTPYKPAPASSGLLAFSQLGKTKSVASYAGFTPTLDRLGW